MHNPILSRAYEDLGPTPHLTCSSRPEPISPPRVPAAIRNLVAELGLRYRPSAQADLEAHAGALALLARDLATVPVEPLRYAVNEHVRTSPYMPKAAELIAGARKFLQGGATGTGNRDSRENAEKLAQKYNEHLRGQGNFTTRWAVDEAGNLALGPA